MARAFQFDVGPVVEQLNRILQMELAAIIYYTHYSFMIYGHARIPITAWLRDNASESLAHAQEAGEKILRLHKRPGPGLVGAATSPAHTNGEIVSITIHRHEGRRETHWGLLALKKGKACVTSDIW